MSTITIQLAPETERKIREKADLVGQTLETFLEVLAEKAVENGTTLALGQEQIPRFISNPRPSQAEFSLLLKELASGSPLPVLPADFSRADIYDDHD